MELLIHIYLAPFFRLHLKIIKTSIFLSLEMRLAHEKHCFLMNNQKIRSAETP